MSESDHRANTPAVNPEVDEPLPVLSERAIGMQVAMLLLEVLQELLIFIKRLNQTRGRISAGSILRRQELIHELKINDATFVRWRDAGLVSRRDLGTKQEFVLADNLIAFLRENPDLTQQARKDR